ncbi:MAG: mannose-6-phosphate isomerase, class I [Deltaproteobacteria bacterium]|nr:mannose-6-phosphate isomerase, class I [Deltaproteobacteria bacterium]
MSKILELRNTLREYAWGSPTLIPDLLGIENRDGGPRAELWMGAHPGAASRVQPDHEWISLVDWIAADPAGCLGDATARQFHGELPFLFKVLAAAEPLSLQAHPDAEQARAGFERENRIGRALDDPSRNYRDARPKPELLCALTPFDAMLGFREIAEIDELIGALELPGFAPRLEVLRGCGETGLRDFFSSLMRSDAEAKAQIARTAAERCAARPDHPARRCVVELASRYPDDVGVLAPLMLNLIRLEIGQAIYLPAGELHSYLAGCGIEIMASSDNVLRGGLTSKHVDESELLDVLTYSSGPAQILEPLERRPGVWTYETPAAEFELSRIDVAGEHLRAASGSVEILLCTAGEGRLESGGSAAIGLARGQAFFVPANAGEYRILGECQLFRAAMPGS